MAFLLSTAIAGAIPFIAGMLDINRHTYAEVAKLNKTLGIMFFVCPFLAIGALVWGVFVDKGDPRIVATSIASSGFLFLSAYYLAIKKSPAKTIP